MDFTVGVMDFKVDFNRFHLISIDFKAAQCVSIGFN
jgi:hypothetical protein